MAGSPHYLARRTAHLPATDGAGWALTPQGVFRTNPYEINEPERGSRVLFSDETLPWAGT